MKQHLYKSIALHVAVFIVFALDLPLFFKPKITIGQAPIIVDLKDVKLSEMTNLPPKAVFGDEEKKPAAPEKKPLNFTKEEFEKEQVPEKEEMDLPKKDFVQTAPEEPKKNTPKPDAKPKPKAPTKPQRKSAPKPQKKPARPKQPQKQEKPQTPKTVSNPLKSLMDSVDAIEKEMGKENSPAIIKTGTQVVNMGVEGGTGGSYFSELTITETDAIAGKLRQCWNLDPGARGIENMIIEIKAFLNKDGTVLDVKIVDTARAAADPHFRAIAESARRAVISCQNHQGVNIYKIFAEKYAEKYGIWNTLLLKFNPMDASVQ